MADPTIAWRCMVCGYIRHGPEPPESCPGCGAARGEYESIREDSSSSDEPGTAEGEPPRVVVIGAGIAGIAAVESLLAAAPSADVTLISRETELPYYRLNLTRYFGGGVKRENLPIHPASWYDEHGIQLFLGAEVCGRDPDSEDCHRTVLQAT